MSDKSSNKPKSERAILHFVTGRLAGQLIKLKKAATIFGRAKGDVLLDDEEVSSSHCQIQCVGEDYYLFDMNSSNGTFVNKKKVLRHKLLTGDLIALGRTELVFKLEEAESVAHIATMTSRPLSSADTGEKTSVLNTIHLTELERERRWQLRLKVTYGDNTAEEFCLTQNLSYLGRATSFGRFSEDPGLSRRHLMLKLNELGEVFAEDQGSTNGSFLNNERLAGIHQVEPGDRIRIGSCVLSVTAERR